MRQDNIVAACGRVGVSKAKQLTGSGIFPAYLCGYWTAGTVEDCAGHNGDRLRAHGFWQGGTVDVLGAVGFGVVDFGSVGGDFVSPVVIGGVEFFAYIDGLRPVGPGAVV